MNNAVYQCGFARSQAAYDHSVRKLFRRLDWLSDRLSDRRYLLGDRITEVDINLFTTLVRFDAVYHGHFKCNRQKLTELPVLWAYARDLFQTPGFGDTVDFVQIKEHYYVVHTDLNPSGIVPFGPDLADWLTPHHREQLGGRPFGDGTPPGPPPDRSGSRPATGPGIRGWPPDQPVSRAVVGLLVVVLAALAGWLVWRSATGSDPVAGSGPAPVPADPAVPARPADAQQLTVRYVYDGDTLQLQAKQPGPHVDTTAKIRVRLIGIDTPEVHPRRSASARKLPTGCGRSPRSAAAVGGAGPGRLGPLRAPAVLRLDPVGSAPELRPGRGGVRRADPGPAERHFVAAAARAGAQAKAAKRGLWAAC